MTDPIETAITKGFYKALIDGANARRKAARGLITTTSDASGREVQILAPEAVTLIQNAALLESVAAELNGARQ